MVIEKTQPTSKDTCTATAERYNKMVFLPPWQTVVLFTYLNIS